MSVLRIVPKDFADPRQPASVATVSPSATAMPALQIIPMACVRELELVRGASVCSLGVRMEAFFAP